ncbi:flagellar hook-associated protein FlgK [Desulfovulcanus sp.]
MPGISSLLNMGRSGLLASQNSIETIGNNIANANNPDYHRQEVRLEEGIGIDYAPGQLGTGVKATEVIRHFDQFIEKEYNFIASNREMWEQVNTYLRGIEGLFKGSEDGDFNDVLSQFWKSWQDLAMRPEDTSTRTALIGHTQNLLNIISLVDAEMDNEQNHMDDLIAQDVNDVNELLKQIAELNRQINIYEEEGKNNANEQRDRRAALVRELAEKMDINYIDNGGGNVTITTKAGHTLIDGSEYFEIRFEGPRSIATLTPGSSFTDSIYFEGSSNYELTVEIVTAGAADGTAQFKVSLDGGETWLKDEDGNVQLFAANNYDNRVRIPGVDVAVWFGASNDSQATATTNLSVGDSFTIVPKKGLYWYRNSSAAMNITPQMYANGQANERRLTGGSLTGFFNFRDHYAGTYQEKFDALAKSLIWEVNRLHSQGAGLSKFSSVTASYSVDKTSTALGDFATGLAFEDKLEAGNFNIYVYDSSGQLVTSGPLDFNNATDGIQNFDPGAHSLEDVRDAINNTFSGYLSASIINNKLVINGVNGYQFTFGQDSSGLLAGLGINTFFDGSDAGNIGLNFQVSNNLNYINAGHVNGDGEVNVGDNQVAEAIAGLQYNDVTIATYFEGATSQSIQEYYNSLVGKVGADTAMSDFNFQYNKTLADDLDSRQQEVSGVNMDEEMSNLIKFQHAYEAAAKLISTANSLFQTLLSLKN